MAAELDKGDSPAIMDSAELDNEPGMGTFIERLNGIKKREAPPSRKRKSEVANDDDDDGSEEERKKAKTTFTPIKSGGDLGEYLKSEREKGAAESGPIDLTAADDEDDEVVFMGETNGTENREVCLGQILSHALVWQIPHVPKYATSKMGKDFWPNARIKYRRSPGTTNIIELYAMASSNNQSLGSRFGNVDGKLARILCPLIDGSAVSKVRLKMYLDAFAKKPGEFPGHRTSRNLTIRVTIYAPRKKADMIGRMLSQAQFFLRAPPSVDPGIEFYNPQVPKILGPTGTAARRPQSSQPTYNVQRTQEEILRETTTMFDSLVKSENLPEMEANGAIILTELLPHQKQALHFMTQHERSDQDTSENESNFSLWKPDHTKQGEAWYNVITSHQVHQKPEPTLGGMLADVMGLGKTLTILALVADTLVEARKFGEQEAPVDSISLKRNSKATLIICPKSVMSNWQEQIKLHTKPGRFRVYSYHGTNRTQDLDELASYNIVLAPYQTAAAEFSDTMSKRSALASTNWFRVVLDEAHQIRNHTTHVSKACCKLAAQRRWAVTGTPVQNKLEDLGALIKFLRIKPFDESSNWSQYITAPFRTADMNVLTNLRLLVNSITLRRSKDKIGLTDRKEWVERLDFSDEELVIYSQFSRASHMQLQLMLTSTLR